MEDRKRRGVVLILTAAILAAFLPMMGLAIDASFLYTIKAKLSVAVDAASLAGARSLNRGMDINSQRTSAETTALAFFNANFPVGHLGTKNCSMTPNVAETAFKTRTVAITASVDAPSYFLRFLGISNTHMVASGMASRRDVNLELVLDRSGSMSGAMTAMKGAAANFVDKFAEGRDNVGLLIFSSSTVQAFPATPTMGPQPNFKSASPNVATQISRMGNGGNTSTAEALSKAFDQLKARNEPGALNLIVFFTDGLPNGVVADYNITDPPSSNLLKDNGFDRYHRPNGCTYRMVPGRPMLGFIARNGGIFSNSNTSVGSDNTPILTLNTDNCYFRQYGSGYVGSDVKSLPSVDAYGNLTTGYVGVNLSLVTDDTQTDAASLNAADSAVQRIRADKNLNVVIYAVGYEGGSERPNETWMKRMANDPSSTYYTTSSPAGLYVKAPTTADLSNAFAKVASEILRLAM